MVGPSWSARAYTPIGLASGLPRFLLIGAIAMATAAAPVVDAAKDDGQAHSQTVSNPSPAPANDFIGPVCEPRFFDADGDCDVDHADFEALVACTSGPAVLYADECGQFDADCDRDIDQTDFAAYQRCYSGDGNLAGPACAGCRVSSVALVHAGEFLMGNTFVPPPRVEGEPDELPSHEVYVDAFYIGRHEVTNCQYADALNWADDQGLVYVSSGIVYGSGNNLLYCFTDQSSLGGEILYNEAFDVTPGKLNHPTRVSWFGAAAYCNWQSQREGRTPCYELSTWTWDCNWGNGYRLPTEAEWEKAARGGAVGRRFPWSDSDSIQHARANYFSNPAYPFDTSPTQGLHPTFDTGAPPPSCTSPVGYFAPNDYGLYDLAGNAGEWCNDWSDPTYYLNSPYDNPRGPLTPKVARVVRGGRCNGNADHVRCASRGSAQPSFAGDGFRLVRDVD